MFLHDSKFQQLYRYNSIPKNGIKAKKYNMGLFPQFSISRIKIEILGQIRVSNSLESRHPTQKTYSKKKIWI